MGQSNKKNHQLPRLPLRKLDAHKGDFGRILVVGGSSGMIGAPALAAQAALRGGAGLVAMAVPQPIQKPVAILCPCATSIGLACDENGDLLHEAVGQFVRAAEAADVIAIGPGFGVGTIQQNIVQAALEQPKPLVLDADGLNNLAAMANWPTVRRCPAVLTPHPGEFSRLSHLPAKEIAANRLDLAQTSAKIWASASPSAGPLVLVLKGAGTVVTDGDEAFVNKTGNPGMATGGSGDVLTGLIAAMIGQGLSPFEAAHLAVHCHGRAGDIAAAQLGQVSMIATDIIARLPEAIKEAHS
ncbi:MAG: NAD(P)H-hydrate dehydratase [Planctomycetes bacterium]|nr:NAD(P)H-hydrate dehydratase [Planctomycetota bacterium]